MTKRASLALKNFDAEKTGRACRKHEEVAKLVAVKRAEDEMARKWKQAEHNIAVLTAASFVRVTCSFKAVSREFAMLLLQGRVTPEVYRDVEKELDKRGHLMSDTEMQSAIYSAMCLMQHRQAATV